MQFLKHLITHHFIQILAFMVMIALIFIAFLPADVRSIWPFIIIWASLMIFISLILGFSNNKLQKNVKEAINTQDKLNNNIVRLKKSGNTLLAFRDALHTTMDPAVVKLMIAKNLRTENRTISVQFTDLQGFTLYAEEKSAAVVLSELNTYLRVMETILLEYKAHIDKYMGDGIMSEFGAPTTYIKQSLLAVASGWKMQKSMKSNNFPWLLRVGVATGVSTIGIIGTRRQAYTAFGDAVNLASRLEGLCEPGRVTVDEATYNECKDYFDFTQKRFSNLNQLENEALITSISLAQTELDKTPESPELMLALATLLLEARDTKQALEHLDKAMTDSPDDDSIKLAYANASMQHNKQMKMEVRGRKKPIQVYELVGLKDPLGNFSNIPEALYNNVKDSINDLIPFPEDLCLPVECLDGSIGQAQLVGIVSYLISDKLKLSTADKSDVLEAAYLADIGKSIVPESILNRPGQLNDDEIKFIHLHPAASVKRLKELGYTNKNLLTIIACHHESINGRGYPEGLSGDAIPLGSRILAVAEAYVSMTSNRPYRDAWEVKPAYLEIVKYAELGKFDAEVVRVLGEIVEELD